MTRAWPPDNSFAVSTRTFPPDTGHRLIAPVRTGASFAEAGWTETDPGIKGASAMGSVVNVGGFKGQYITATVNSPATISDLPSNGLRWTVTTRTLLNSVRGSNTNDLLAAMFGTTALADPPSADLILGWFITNGTVGFGGGLLATAAAGDWQCFALSQAAGVWTRTAGGAAAATTTGVRVQAETSNGALTRVVRVIPLNSSLAELPTAAGAAPGGTLTLNDGLSTFGMYTGWATGVGGSAGTAISIAGAEELGEPHARYLAGT